MSSSEKLLRNEAIIPPSQEGELLQNDNFVLWSDDPPVLVTLCAETFLES